VDLTHPEDKLLSPGLASVLRALAGTRSPLTGRVIAGLSGLSQNGALKVLHQLLSAGIVQSEPAGRALLFRLNRSHLLTSPLLQIIDADKELRRRLEVEIAGWTIQPIHVSIFGSVARREAGRASDIDLLAIRPETVSFDDLDWRTQLSELSGNAYSWTGLGASWLELSEAEFNEAVAQGEPIVTAWRRDSLYLAGEDLEDLIHRSASRR
jgi:predicted nucleotidyltransferase